LKFIRAAKRKARGIGHKQRQTHGVALDAVDEAAELLINLFWRGLKGAPVDKDPEKDPEKDSVPAR
jgi:hypothetical protein